MSIPSAITRACIVMAPRLDAEAAMAHANQIAFGSGKLSPESMSQLQRLWEGQATPPEPRQRTAVGIGTLQGWGIPVRLVPTTRKAS